MKQSDFFPGFFDILNNSLNSYGISDSLTECKQLFRPDTSEKVFRFGFIISEGVVGEQKEPLYTGSLHNAHNV